MSTSQFVVAVTVEHMVPSYQTRTSLHGHIEIVGSNNLLPFWQACTVKFEIIHSINLGLFGYCVSVKFSPRKQWVVSGDSKGRIRVYIYFDGSEVKKFKAHGGAVRSLAVHPTRPFLLSSSDDCLIKIWDWDNGWICTREYWAHWSAVRQVTFRPMDTDTFASVSGAYGSIWPGSIKVSSFPILSTKYVI